MYNEGGIGIGLGFREKETKGITIWGGGKTGRWEDGKYNVGAHELSGMRTLRERERGPEKGKRMYMTVQRSKSREGRKQSF